MRATLLTYADAQEHMARSTFDDIIRLSSSTRLSPLLILATADKGRTYVAFQQEGEEKAREFWYRHYCILIGYGPATRKRRFYISRLDGVEGKSPPTVMRADTLWKAMDTIDELLGSGHDGRPELEDNPYTVSNICVAVRDDGEMVAYGSLELAMVAVNTAENDPDEWTVTEGVVFIQKNGGK